MGSVHKVAMVTGAGSGVGKASALALAREGYVLVLVGRRVKALDQTAAEIESGAESGSGKPPTLVVSANVGDPAAVNEVFAKTKDRFGRLDLLFNNAGIGAPGVPMEELSYEQWKAVVDVNLTGAFLCTQGALRLMKSQEPRGGRIINNGSVSAQTPRPNSAPYTATKHAVTGLTKSTALDGRAFDIACGQIDIGNAVTSMTARMAQGVPQADGSLGVEARMAVEDIARAVVYMASLPLDANVLTMTVMATKMPLVGRG